MPPNLRYDCRHRWIRRRDPCVKRKMARDGVKTAFRYVAGLGLLRLDFI